MNGPNVAIPSMILFWQWLHVCSLALVCNNMCCLKWFTSYNHVWSHACMYYHVFLEIVYSLESCVTKKHIHGLVLVCSGTCCWKNLFSCKLGDNYYRCVVSHLCVPICVALNGLFPCDVFDNDHMVLVSISTTMCFLKWFIYMKVVSQKKQIHGLVLVCPGMCCLK